MSTWSPVQFSVHNSMYNWSPVQYSIVCIPGPPPVQYSVQNSLPDSLYNILYIMSTWSHVQYSVHNSLTFLSQYSVHIMLNGIPGTLYIYFYLVQYTVHNCKPGQYLYIYFIYSAYF